MRFQFTSAGDAKPDGLRLPTSNADAFADIFQQHQQMERIRL